MTISAILVTYLHHVGRMITCKSCMLNPLYPSINMHILHTAFHTWPKVRTSDHFLYSHDRNERFKDDIARRE